MIITGLLFLISLAVLTQPNAPRLFAAFIFVAVTLAHELFFSHLDGLAYYGSAALLDLTVIILTTGIRPIPEMVIKLHLICAVSIAVNFAGWLVWLAYLPPTAYDLVFIGIYTWVLITLSRRNGSDVGGFTMDSWHSCIRFNWYSRLVHHDHNGNRT